MLIVLGLLTLGFASSKASAGLVLDFGGRIVATDASGLDREELVAQRIDDPSFGDIDLSVAVSRDGSKLAFIDEVEVESGPSPARLVVGTPPGPQRTVLFSTRGKKEVYVSSPSWMPNGDILAEVQRSAGPRSLDTLVMRFRLDGSKPSVIHKRTVRATKRGYQGSFFSRFEVSPDGKTLLLDVSTGRSLGSSRVVRINLSTGRSTIVRRNADGGSWSPEGKSIVFESDHEMINKNCYDGWCSGDKKLYIKSLTSGAVDRLTQERVPGNETEAAWSPDGKTIAFVSDRNGSEYSEQPSEIYTVRTDGSCLTWITNGAPASSSPVWDPTSTGSEPSRCGMFNRPPVSELFPDPNPLVNGEPITWPRLWLGPVYERKAQSLFPDDGRELWYDDCTRITVKACGRFYYQVGSDDICLGWPQQFAKYGAIDRVKRIRGALVFLPAGNRPMGEAIVATGGQAVSVTAEDSRGKGVPVARFVKAIMQLRPVQDSSATEPLEAPVIERGMVIRSKRILKAIDGTDSLKEAAKKLGMSPKKFRSWQAIANGIEEFGPIETKSCGGWIRPWDVGL